MVTIKKTIIICVIAITSIIFFRGCVDFFDSTSEEEMIEIFKKNKTTFTNASQDLIEFEYHWSIKEGKYRSGHIRPDWKGINLRYGIHLIIKNEEDFEYAPSFQKVIEENKNIRNIVKKLNFKEITSNDFVDDGCVYFIKETAIGFDSGIIYCPDGKPKNQYLRKLTPIEPSWYYYESN